MENFSMKFQFYVIDQNSFGGIDGRIYLRKKMLGGALMAFV